MSDEGSFSMILLSMAGRVPSLVMTRVMSTTLR